MWWQFLNFGCTRAITIPHFPASFLIFPLFRRFVSREATFLTQTRLHVNGSSHLGNALVIHQRLFERRPVSLMGPHSEAVRINGKTPVTKALMPVQIRFQSAPKKGSAYGNRAWYLIILVHGHMVHARESVFASIPLQKILHVSLAFWQMLKTDQEQMT